MHKSLFVSPGPLGPWVLLLLSVCGCGPGVRRDLASIRQQQVTYDDLCHLQDYFDQRAVARTQAFRVVNEQSVETTRLEADERGRMRPVLLGEGTYRVRDRSDRLRFRQLLREEFKRLPEMRILPQDAVVDVHVSWWQSGTIRRLRPDADIEVEIDGESVDLPYQPCVGEFLFGDNAYAMRRDIVGAERARARGEIPTQYLHPDAGESSDGGAPDAPGVVVSSLSERVDRAVGVLGGPQGPQGPQGPEVPGAPGAPGVLGASLPDAGVTDANVVDASVTDANATDARAHRGRHR